MSEPLTTSTNGTLAWDWSDSIVKIAPAFVKAQAAIKAAPKNNVNDHFNNRYADLAAVDEASRPALNAAGIGVLQFPATAEAGKLGLTTLLLHESGEWISATGTIPLGRDAGPQGFGSAMTYARRYFLSAMVGVCPEDDDANGANGDGKQQGGKNAPQQRQPQRQQAPSKPLATAEQVEEIHKLLESRSLPDGLIATWFKKAKAREWAEMPADAIASCITYVKEKGTPKAKQADPLERCDGHGNADPAGNYVQPPNVSPPATADLSNDNTFWSAARKVCQDRGIVWDMGRLVIGAILRRDGLALPGCDNAKRNAIVGELATGEPAAMKKMADDYAATQNKAA